MPQRSRTGDEQGRQQADGRGFSPPLAPCQGRADDPREISAMPSNPAAADALTGKHEAAMVTSSGTLP